MAALSNQELTDKLDAMIKVINDIQVAMTHLAAKAQLRQLTLLNQTDINDLKNRVSSLETQIAILQAE